MWDFLPSRDIYVLGSTKDTVMIDIRKKEEYCKGHIAGMINIYDEELISNTDILVPFKNVILCCNRGNRGLIVAKKLSSLFRNKHFFNVYGGIHHFIGEKERCNGY